MPEPGLQYPERRNGQEFVGLGDGFEGAVTDTGLKLSLFEDSKHVSIHFSADETRRLIALLSEREAELGGDAATAMERTHFDGTAEPGEHIHIADYRIRGGSEIPTNRRALEEFRETSE
jgi:hypothetical protein